MAWNSGPVAFLVLLLGTVAAAGTSVLIPSPGVAIGLLATAAAIMSIRTEMRPAEKMAWLAILIVFSTTEIRSIAKTDYQNTKDREAQQKEFRATADGLKAAYQLSQNQFQATMSANATVLGKTEQAADMARQGVANITGGNSWAYIELATTSPNTGQIVPHLIVRGQYPLRHLQLRVLDYRSFISYYAQHPVGSPTEVVAQSATITELGDVPNTGSWILTPIGINTDDSTDKNYNIELRALNGGCREYLRFRRIYGKWVTAIRVVAFDNKRNGQEGKLLMERIDDTFPRTNGNVDWRE